MFSTVAVGTDGSATAGEAIDKAVEIAKRFDAKLVLLSATHGPAPGDGFATTHGVAPAISAPAAKPAGGH